MELPTSPHQSAYHSTSTSYERLTAFAAEYKALCTKYNLVLCLACRKPHSPNSMKSRGLCRPCYDNKDEREEYSFRKRGGWADGSRAWDFHDKMMLLDMLCAKMTDQQIAKQINRTVRAIGKARRRLGIQRDRLTGKLTWPKELDKYRKDTNDKIISDHYDERVKPAPGIWSND